MKETLADTLPKVIHSLLKNIHTSMPGKIDSYDRGSARATITPLLNHVTANNKVIEIKPITDVPVIMFGGSSGLVDIELVKGDNVLLIFSEAEIGGWKSSSGKKQVAPEDLSHHELTNAFAIPCLIPDGINLSSSPRVMIDKDGTITLQNDSGNVKLASNGTVSINDHFTVEP